MNPNDMHDRSPPEGAYCTLHPERIALAACPRCGAYACLACWHAQIDRCHACVLRNPGELTPPVAWENPERSLISRWFLTLVSAVSPSHSAPAFVNGEPWPARVFALLTFLPLALLSGIIPYTHRLRFGGGQVLIDAGIKSYDIVVDVARAMGIAAFVNIVGIVALGLPYVSLSNAFGAPTRTHAAERVLLYRAWLLPLSALILSLFAWLLPSDADFALQKVAEVVALAPTILFFMGIHATARIGSGVGPFAAMMVVGVPFIIMQLAQLLLFHALSPWIPPVLNAVAP